MVNEIVTELENRPGSLIRATQALAQAGVDIRGMNVSQGEQTSQVRWVVDNTQQAISVLEENGIQVWQNQAIGVWLQDQSGSMNPILTALGDQQENIQTIYPIFDKSHQNVGVVINSENPERAMQILKENNIQVIDQQDIQ